MRTVDMEEAKSNLPVLVEEASKGQPFIIVEAGKPKLEVTVKTIEEDVPYTGIRLGLLKGYNIPDDFDTMADQEIAEMVRILEEKQF